MDTQTQFIGPNPILNIEPLTIKDSQGIDREYVKVTYVDNSVETFAKVTFDILVSDKSDTDLTELRTKALYPVVTEILDTLFKYNLKVSDLDALMQLVSSSINKNITDALDFALASNSYNRTLLDIDKVLTSKNDVKVTVADVVEKGIAE